MTGWHAVGRRLAACAGKEQRGWSYTSYRFYPVNVLNALKLVPEVCRIFCATANATEVVIAETAQGRGILGVIDGAPPVGVEDEAGIAWRKGLLRTIGYKL